MLKKELRTDVISVVIASLFSVSAISQAAADGTNWTSRTSAADNEWYSVTYGNGLFVAVMSTAEEAVDSGNRVMTSPDGITWTSQTSAADNSWRSVTYGNGLFVAVSSSGLGNRVMTSPNGINWTTQTTPRSGSPLVDNNWRSVTYGIVNGNGLFVAVSSTGSGNRVMTSPDGIAWTSRSSAADNEWYSVTYGNGLFVAVSIAEAAVDREKLVMTSPDGITWTSQTSAADNFWRSVTYGIVNGVGLFVAVSDGGYFQGQVMTSPNGTNWTSRTSAANNEWRSVTYGNGLFVAVSSTGSGNRVMTSGEFRSLATTGASANAEAERVAAANAEAARKAKEQRELTEILALIPSIGELTLSLGEVTKSLYSTKCVKGKTIKFVKKGSKCPKGYVKKK
jgi:hypothetical protein